MIEQQMADIFNFFTFEKRRRKKNQKTSYRSLKIFDLEKLWHKREELLIGNPKKYENQLTINQRKLKIFPQDF